MRFAGFACPQLVVARIELVQDKTPAAEANHVNTRAIGSDAPVVDELASTERRNESFCAGSDIARTKKTAALRTECIGLAQITRRNLLSNTSSKKRRGRNGTRPFRPAALLAISER
jgi:hypothetical protein